MEAYMVEFPHLFDQLKYGIIRVNGTEKLYLHLPTFQRNVAYIFLYYEDRDGIFL
jgi:hypothetical protein